MDQPDRRALGLPRQTSARHQFFNHRIDVRRANMHAAVAPTASVIGTSFLPSLYLLAEANARPELDRPDHASLASLLAMGVQAAGQLVAATPDAVNPGLREALIRAARILGSNTYVPIANYPPSVGATMAAIAGTCPIMRRFAASQYFIDAPRQDTSWGATLPDFPASLAPDGAVIYIPYNVASTANVTLESVAAAEAPKPQDPNSPGQARTATMRRPRFTGWPLAFTSALRGGRNPFQIRM